MSPRGVPVTDLAQDGPPSADPLSRPFTPGMPDNSPELAEMTANDEIVRTVVIPLADVKTREFVEEWRNASYNCYLVGAQVLPRGLPGHAGHPQRVVDADGVPRQRRRDGTGELDIEDVADDYVNCTQCGACELRCPNTLFTGDFYRFRTRTVDVVKAVRALAVDTGIHQPGWKRWNESTDERSHEPVLGDAAGRPGARCATGRRVSTSRSAARRSCSSTARPPSTAPRVPRAVAQILQKAGVRVRADGRAVVLRRPGRRDGLRRPGARVRRAQPRRLARHRRHAHPRARPARLHHLHRGLPEVLRRRLRHRDRAGRRAVRRADPRRTARSASRRRARDHLPRPVPAEQAQGHLARAARDPARHPGSALQGRRPRHAVVLLLRRWRRAADREARDHRGDQRAAPSRTAQKLEVDTLVSACPWSERPLTEAGDDADIDVVDIHELLANSLGIEVGGTRGAPATVGSRRPHGCGGLHRTPRTRWRMRLRWLRLDGACGCGGHTDDDDDRGCRHGRPRPAHRPGRRADPHRQGRPRTTARGCRRRSRCTAGRSACPTSSCCRTPPSRSPRSSRSPTTCAIPVVPRDGGTGLTDGAVPLRGGIVVDVKRMNQIHELDLVEPHRDRRHRHQHAQAQRGAAPARPVLPRRPGVVPVLAGRRPDRHQRLVADRLALRAHPRPGAELRPRAADRRDPARRRRHRRQDPQVLQRLPAQAPVHGPPGHARHRHEGDARSSSRSPRPSSRRSAPSTTTTTPTRARARSPAPGSRPSPAPCCSTSRRSRTCAATTRPTSRSRQTSGRWCAP